MEEAIAARNAPRRFDRNGPVFPIPSKTPATHKDGCQMETGQAVDLVRHTLLIALTISAPMLIIGLVVGIVISLLQAVTQIQEQTLTFVPKIAAMIVAAIVLMPWIGQHLLEYSAKMFSTGQLP